MSEEEKARSVEQQRMDFAFRQRLGAHWLSVKQLLVDKRIIVLEHPPTSLSAHVIVYGDVKDQGPILVTLNATEVPEDNWSAGTPKSTNLTEDQPATDLRSCQNDEFQCYGDFRCIPLTWRCDKEADCKDASDERYCGKYNTKFGNELSKKKY
ncbi:hypothetical protein TNIN_335131 [Trichonephila inaurata madagascariensis]|uniref:Uncharacterized protein n=1 Tax=Trichonephila inaurata madagascariensis TaxID=2747483 RepID=A0A8X6XHK1_9ARAC|nr:hypothetical protein TNIN_335131 [Trichonephila inaurata madagascariensis]